MPVAAWWRNSQIRSRRTRNADMHARRTTYTDHANGPGEEVLAALALPQQRSRRWRATDVTTDWKPSALHSTNVRSSESSITIGPPRRGERPASSHFGEVGVSGDQRRQPKAGQRFRCRAPDGNHRMQPGEGRRSNRLYERLRRRRTGNNCCIWGGIVPDPKDRLGRQFLHAIGLDGLDKGPGLAQPIDQQSSSTRRRGNQHVAAGPLIPRPEAPPIVRRPRLRLRPAAPGRHLRRVVPWPWHRQPRRFEGPEARGRSGLAVTQPPIGRWRKQPSCTVPVARPRK